MGLITVVSADETDSVNNGYVNAGILVVTNGATETIDDPVVLGSITNTGILDAGSGSSLIIAGPVRLFGATDSFIENSGTLIAEGGTITVQSVFDQLPGGELDATQGGTILMKASIAGGIVQLTDSILAFDFPGHVAPGPLNAKLTTTPVHLGGASDVLAIGDATSLQFDPDTNTLVAYLPYEGQPYEIGEFHLTGTYTADEFSIQHGDVVYQAPSSVSLDVYDTSDRTALPATLSTYNGPVAELDYEYVNLTKDNLNITATTRNAFIHAGSGMDGLTVMSGNNVLDGGGGSDFMIGGTGRDTFYLDGRNATAPVFSTIVNFHGGDAATVWGVNASDFTTTVLYHQGAAGAQGVDLIFSAPGHADVSFVLAGYSSADLTNGRLSLSYGKTADLPGLPGSEYMTVRAM